MNTSLALNPASELPSPWLADWWSRGDSNAKLAKTQDRLGGRYRAHILMLAHAMTSGHNTCPNASKTCIEACSTSRAGIAGAFPEHTMRPRIAKTLALLSHRVESIEALTSELIRKNAEDREAAVESANRWNGAQDLPFWSTAWTRSKVSPIERVYNARPTSQNYDYGKNLSWYNKPEFRRLYDAGIYSVCWSRSEINHDQIVELLRAGQDCSVVFHEPGAFSGPNAGAQRLPDRYTLNGQRFRVLDGDMNDIRSLDPDRGRGKLGRIIGLRLKSHTRAQRQGAIDSGFSLPAFP